MSIIMVVLMMVIMHPQATPAPPHLVDGVIVQGCDGEVGCSLYVADGHARRIHQGPSGAGHVCADNVLRSSKSRSKIRARTVVGKTAAISTVFLLLVAAPDKIPANNPAKCQSNNPANSPAAWAQLPLLHCGLWASGIAARKLPCLSSSIAQYVICGGTCEVL